MALGLVTPPRVTDTAVEAFTLGALPFEIYGEPSVALLIEKPDIPDWAFKVAAVVVRPAGLVQAPEAVVQYWNLMEPILAVVPVVMVMALVVVRLAWLVPSCTARGASAAALAETGNRAASRAIRV